MEGPETKFDLYTRYNLIPMKLVVTQNKMQRFIVMSCLIAESKNFSAFLVTGTASPATYQVLGVLDVHILICLVKLIFNSNIIRIMKFSGGWCFKILNNT